MFGDIPQISGHRISGIVTVREAVASLVDRDTTDPGFKVGAQVQCRRGSVLCSLGGLMMQFVCGAEARVHVASRHADMGSSTVLYTPVGVD